MTNFKRRTYNDSYLFNQDSDKANRANRNLVDFIIKSDRINKNSAEFRGVIEDVKRMQTSSILYSVLMMDDVELCINSVELPRAFKVFEAKDLKLSRTAPTKVFIDVTGLITFKDGYFYCKKIDWLITYLFSALGYLMYSKSPMKLLNNSNITISSTECYVSLFIYILNYLRIIGFDQNKAKIAYLAGLFYQYHLLGKDIDTYAKNISAKIAGIGSNDIRAYELYYDVEKDFMNIESFINLITETFKLKGLDVEVFIGKWMYQFGTGTEYGVELFTSFSTILTNTYCGSYVIHQKQVERCCGKSMVNYATALLRVGVEEFDKSRFMESGELDKMIPRDKATQELAESFLGKSIPKDLKFEISDYETKSKCLAKFKKVIDYYNSNNLEKKLSRRLVKDINGVSIQLNLSARGERKYEAGTMAAVIKATVKYLSEKDRTFLMNAVDLAIESFGVLINKNRDTDKEKAKEFAKAQAEYKKALGAF